MKNEEMTKIEAEELVGVCGYCGNPINLDARYWRRFCDDKCRYSWHKAAAKMGRKILKERAEDPRTE